MPTRVIDLHRMSALAIDAIPDLTYVDRPMRFHTAITRMQT